MYNRTSPQRRKKLYGDFDVVIVCSGITKYMQVKHKDDMFLRNLSIAVERSQGRPLRPGGNLQEWLDRGILFIDPDNVTSKQMILIVGDLAFRYDNKVFMFWGSKANTHATRVHNLNETHHVYKGDHPGNISCDTNELSDQLTEVAELVKNLFGHTLKWSN